MWTNKIYISWQTSFREMIRHKRWAPVHTMFQSALSNILTLEGSNTSELYVFKDSVRTAK